MKTKICVRCGKKLVKATNAQKYCKQCAKELQKKHIKNWSKKNKERLAKYYRKYNLENRYNLTLEQWQQMYDKQNGCCAICEQPEVNRGLSVDHKHSDGKVRALLCNKCNHLVGIIESGFWGLEDKVNDYIERHNA